MSVIIQLADLVTSDYYFEGCILHDKKSTMILSAVQENGLTVIRGAAAGCSVMLKADKSGVLKEKSCSCGKGTVCEHVVAVALVFNEIAMDNTDISEQLAKFSSKSDSRRCEFPCRIEINRKNGIVRFEKDGGDLQLKLVSSALEGEDLLLLISLCPEKFMLGSMQLAQADSPLILSYQHTSSNISFSLPESVFYSERNGVAIDLDEGLVWRFSRNVNETLSALIGLSLDYSKKDDLIKSISDLNDAMNGEVLLSGEFNLEKVLLDENTQITFKTSISEGKVFLGIFLENGRTSVEFHPRKKILEQNYPVGGRVYSLAPQLVKNIKAALAAENFKLFKNSYVVPMHMFSRIISPESALNQIGKVVNEQDVRKINIPESAADDSEIILDVNADEQWFSFNIKLPQSADFISSTELVKAVEQYSRGIDEPVVFDVSGKPFILQNSGDFLNRILDMIGSGVGSGEKVPVAHLVKLLKSKNKKVLKNFTGSKDAQQKYMTIFESLSKGVLPRLDDTDLSGIPLRNYQTDGFKWMSLLKTLGLGGVLADEMGLGKTLQSLTMIKAEKGDLPSMVVCPKTLVWSWDREVEKFFPEMKRTVIDSLKPEERVAKWKSADKELIITSYAVVINDYRYVREKSFETIIVDEAQHIKNNNTKRFRTLSSLNAKHRFALTGTPLENHLSDLWSIFQFVMPGYLGDRKEIDRIEKNGSGDEMEKLREQTSPFILRRLKSEILNELPELIIKEYPVEMTPKQKDVYLSTMLRGKAEFIEKGDAINKIEILAILSRLRLAADHPSLASEGDMDPDLSGKTAAVLELCEEIFSGKGRVLIFSQYVKMLKIIETAFNANNIGYFYMDGDTKDRMELVEKFNKGEKDAFLLSLKVGGVGLNLTGADHVIIVDPWWNPAAEEQAWSRAHRIGQTKEVVVTKLYSKGTIEEKILNLHQKKRDMTDFFLSKSLKEPGEDFVRMLADLAFTE